jgi:hypothetical protein
VVFSGPLQEMPGLSEHLSGTRVDRRTRMGENRLAGDSLLRKIHPNKPWFCHET